MEPYCKAFLFFIWLIISHNITGVSLKKYVFVILNENKKTLQ